MMIMMSYYDGPHNKLSTVSTQPNVGRELPCLSFQQRNQHQTFLSYKSLLHISPHSSFIIFSSMHENKFVIYFRCVQTGSKNKYKHT